MDGSDSNSSSNSSTKSARVIDVNESQNLLNGLALESGVSPDWQLTKREVKEHLEYFFTNQLHCDVQFVVGRGSEIVKIGAHKTVLGARSPVFLAMFSDKWCTDSSDIKVDDVEAAPFIEMLRFLYSDKVSLTTKNVTLVIYVAKKYALVALEEKCEKFLLKKLRLENVFSILLQAKLFNLQKLVDGCLEFIAGDTVGALKTNDFCDIDVETLCLVLERSNLNISEIELFAAVNRWSKAACEKVDLPIDAENQRSVLKNALSLIRFPTMDPEEFSTKVVDSGILSEEELISVFRCFTIKSEPYECIFSKIPRGRPYIVSRFKSETSGGAFGGDDWTLHRLLFKANRNFHLTGIGLYGSPNHSAVYPTDITVTGYIPSQSSHTLATLSPTMRRSFGVYNCNSQKIFRAMFEKSVALNANVTYGIQVKIKGKFFLYGCGGLQTYEVRKAPEETVTFTFCNYEAVSSENERGRKTDSCSGQIPELLFEI